jgi:transposase
MGKQRHIYLNENERTELEQLIKSGHHSARVLARARTLLLLDRSQGKKRTIQEVVEAAMVSQGTVSNTKKRYFTGGVDEALYEKPRPGAKPKIDGEVEAHLITIACSDPPEGYERWTLRLLADELVTLELVESISHVAVRNALRRTNLSLGK